MSDPGHLGLRDNQVSGDLKSSNEGTQLNLLIGANRKSVPKGVKRKIRLGNITSSSLLQEKRSKMANPLKDTF